MQELVERDGLFLLTINKYKTAKKRIATIKSLAIVLSLIILNLIRKRKALTSLSKLDYRISSYKNAINKLAS